MSWDGRYMGKISVPSPQFRCESKTALGNKSIKKKKKSKRRPEDHCQEYG